MPRRILDVGQASDIAPVTPSNTTPLPAPGVIRCKPDGTAGALRVMTAAGEDRTTYIEVGEILLVTVTQVFATGTDADGLEVMT